MKTLLIQLLSLVILLTACKRVSSNETSTASGKTTEKKETGQPDILKLVQHQVMDKEGTGLVASSYLLPEGWTVNDRLYWEYNDAVVPIRFKSQMKSADGTMGIQVFPDVRTSWNTGPAGTSGYAPPAGIIAGLKDLIKAERAGISYRFTGEKLLSSTSRTLQQGTTESAQTGVITIEYEENGSTYEEEFYGRLDVLDMNTPSAMGPMRSLTWAGSGLMACKAPKGKLEEVRKITQTVATSAQLTKPFYNRLVQVTKLLSDQFYARVYQAGQISKIISQTNDQMIANIDQSYRQSQQAAERNTSQFSDYMRGVDRYDDNGSEVQLPSGYSNAWVNEQGQYILSNTGGYDPNRELTGNWRELGKN